MSYRRQRTEAWSAVQGSDTIRYGVISEMVI